jgi:hypothetical protein
MTRRCVLVSPVILLFASILLLATSHRIGVDRAVGQGLLTPTPVRSGTIPEEYLRYHESFTSTHFSALTLNANWDVQQGQVTLERRHVQRQDSVIAASNDAGHIYLIWEDARRDDGDIFAQRIDAAGNRMWTADRRVHRNTADVLQSSPAAAVDAFGNLVVTWVDRRNGGDAIYAQRLSPDGNYLWSDDLRISQRDGTQGEPAIVQNVDGGCVIAWHGDANGDYDIFAQQIDDGGARRWPVEIRVNGDASMQSQVSPALWSTSAGHTLVVWLDQRYGIRDLYAQQLDSHGARLWQEDRRITSSTTAAVNAPRVAGSRANEAWIAWQSGDGSRIALQKISESGDLLFPSPRFLAMGSVGADGEAPPALAVIAGDLVIAWRTTAPAMVVAQRLDAQGVVRWPAALRLNVSSHPVAAPQSPALASVTATALFAAWPASDANRQTGVYGQQFAETGMLHWPHDRRFSDATGKSDQTTPALAVTAAGHSIVAWEDNRAGQPAIYLQRFDAVGRRLWGAAVRLNRQTPADTAQQSPAVAMVGEEVAAIWTDRRNGQARIYVQRLDGAGQLVWTRDSAVSREQAGAFEQVNGAVAANADSIAIAWEEARGQERRIRVQRLNLQGQPQWPVDIVVSPPHSRGRLPRVMFDHTGALWVIWLATQADETDVLAQRLDRAGALLWGQPTPVNHASGLVDALTAPSLGGDAAGNATIAWSDKRGLLLAQRLDGAGNRLWEREKVLATAGGAPLVASLAVAADGHFITAWQASAARGMIALQRFDAAGAPVWNNGAAVMVSPMIRSGRLPQLAFDGEGQCTVVWQEERFLNADVFAQRIDRDGQRLWSDDQPVLGDDAFFVQQGLVRSKEVDVTAARIHSARLTAYTDTRGGEIRFALSNDNGTQWEAVEPGELHRFTASGSALRWQAMLTVASDRLGESPRVDELTIDYAVEASTGVTVSLPLIQR